MYMMKIEKGLYGKRIAPHGVGGDRKGYRKDKRRQTSYVLIHMQKKGIFSGEGTRRRREGRGMGVSM